MQQIIDPGIADVTNQIELVPASQYLIAGKFKESRFEPVDNVDQQHELEEWYLQ